ncbi:DJ-1/PfpI family protein [Cellvibrio sp.]|jgi:transcriptional regulator GlxA family with amidase domain
MENTPAQLPPTIKIGILVFPDFEPLDVWGFIEAFSISRFIGTNYSDPAPYPFQIELISTEEKNCAAHGQPQAVRSYNGARVTPDWFRDEALEQSFDVLMIPGGQGVRTLMGMETNNPHAFNELMQWIKIMDQLVPIMTSVCTGAALLARSGVLDDKPAATNHQAFAWVTQFGPNVRWDNVSRWVDAGKYVTSAGVSAGTDMAFHLVSRLAGRAVAEVAAKAAEYDWHRNPDTAIYYPQQASVPSSR